MSRKSLLSASVGLLTLGLAATAAYVTPVHAAPLSGVAAATAADGASSGSLVERTDWYGRRYDSGRRHYYRHDRPYYSYRYDYPRYYRRYDDYPRYYYPRHRYYRYRHWY